MNPKLTNILTTYKSTLIIIAIIIVLALAAWGIVKFTGLGEKINDIIASKKLDETLDAEISTERVTYSEADADNYVRKLYQAMKGIGTDEDAIYEVMSHMQTRSDVLYLIKKFSVKDGLTLNEWITAELSAKERTHVNMILSTNNVNYTF